MANIVLDLTGAPVPQHAVDQIMTRVDSSVVPQQSREKNITFSYTFTNGLVSQVNIATAAGVPIDQVANLVRRFQLFGKVRDRQPVRLASVPAEVSPFQAYI